MSFCEHFIEIKGDFWAGTYCKLRAGHDGAHSAHYPVESRRPEPRVGTRRRCCGLWFYSDRIGFVVLTVSLWERVLDRWTES